MTFHYIDVEDVLQKSRECSEQFLLGVYNAMSLNTHFIFNASFDTLKSYVLHDANLEYFQDLAKDFAMKADLAVFGPEEMAGALMTTVSTLASTSWFSDRVGDHAPWKQSIDEQKRMISHVLDNDMDNALKRARRTENWSRKKREIREAEESARRKTAAIRVNISADDAFSFLTACWSRIQDTTENVLAKQHALQKKNLEVAAALEAPVLRKIKL